MEETSLLSYRFCNLDTAISNVIADLSCLIEKIKKPDCNLTIVEEIRACLISLDSLTRGKIVSESEVNKIADVLPCLKQAVSQPIFDTLKVDFKKIDLFVRSFYLLAYSRSHLVDITTNVYYTFAQFQAQFEDNTYENEASKVLFLQVDNIGSDYSVSDKIIWFFIAASLVELICKKHCDALAFEDFISFMMNFMEGLLKNLLADFSLARNKKDALSNLMILLYTTIPDFGAARVHYERLLQTVEPHEKMSQCFFTLARYCYKEGFQKHEKYAKKAEEAYLAAIQYGKQALTCPDVFYQEEIFSCIMQSCYQLGSLYYVRGFSSQAVPHFMKAVNAGMEGCKISKNKNFLNPMPHFLNSIAHFFNILNLLIRKGEVLSDQQKFEIERQIKTLETVFLHSYVSNSGVFYKDNSLQEAIYQLKESIRFFSQGICPLYLKMPS
jgi:tetratricopeptide (TPR) repeat protein